MYFITSAEKYFCLASGTVGTRVILFPKTKLFPATLIHKTPETTWLSMTLGTPSSPVEH